MALEFVRASSQYIGYGTGGGVGASNDWTAAAWVYDDGTTDVMYVAKRDSYASGQNQFSFGTGDNVNNVTISANNANRRNATVQVPTGQWSFVAGGSDSSNAFTYCNGTIETNFAALVSGTATDQVFQIGARDLTPAGFMDGRIAEVGVWNVKLTQAELDSLNSGLSFLFVRPSALQHYMRLFNTGTISDIVGGLVGTANNSPTNTAHPSIIYPPSYQNKGNLYLNRRKIGEPASSPPSVTLVDTYDTDVNVTSPTISSLNFGNATSNRQIIVAASYNTSSAGSITAMTIGGVSATQIEAAASASDTKHSCLWIADVPSGSTGSVAITSSAEIANIGFGVFRTEGLSTTPDSTDTQLARTSTTGITVGPVDVAFRRAVMIAVFYTNLPTDTWSMSNTASRVLYQEHGAAGIGVQVGVAYPGLGSYDVGINADVGITPTSNACLAVLSPADPS